MNALSIVVGSFLGSAFKNRIRLKNFSALGIGIMIISMVGFFENIYDVKDISLESDNLLVVVFSLIIGIVLGDAIKLEERIANISSLGKNGFSEIADATVFFGVGGMQILGPIMLATMGDSSQLFMKGMIDFPFALMFGISYGKKAAFSALPVACGQVVILVLTLLMGHFLNGIVIKQLCAMGYIILFFSGYNLICEKKNKINNINMVMGIFIIIFYNVVKNCF